MRAFLLCLCGFYEFYQAADDPQTRMILGNQLVNFLIMFRDLATMFVKFGV